MTTHHLRVLAAAFTAIVTLVTVSLRVASAGADNTLGTAVMAAFVNQPGTLVRGSGATGVFKAGTGSYLVYFDRNVEDNCFVTATPILADATIYTDTNNPTAIYVTTLSRATGNPADIAFNMIVFCSK